jgi:hypothetical protein
MSDTGHHVCANCKGYGTVEGGADCPSCQTFAFWVKPRQGSTQPARPAFPMPEFVRVLGLDVPLLLRSPELDTKLDSWHGYFDPSRSRVVLNELDPVEERRDTVWHELLHACEKVTATDLPEEAVTRISRAQIAILRDNPALVRWLMEDA